MLPACSNKPLPDPVPSPGPDDQAAPWPIVPTAPSWRAWSGTVWETSRETGPDRNRHAGARGHQLAACAEFSPDGGMGAVQSGVRQEIGKNVVKIASRDDARRAKEQVASLLQGQLSAASTVQIGGSQRF